MKVKELRVDGYKNLGHCVLPIRDFNVLVGPNNSGKSNLLEVFRVIWCLCFGTQEERRGFLLGLPVSRGDLSGPFWWHPAAGPLSIGFTFETLVGNEPWVVDFDATVKRAPHPTGDVSVGFESELLKAKQPSKTGPAKTYLRRDGKTLRVGDRTHPIPAMASAISALAVLYPEPGSIPSELSVFLGDIHTLARSPVYSFSPEALRNSLQDETPPPAHRVSSYGLLATLDKIFQSKDKAEVFKSAVCGILDLKDVAFKGFDAEMPKARSGQEEKRTGRIRFCFLQKKFGGFDELSEYSDGTLIVTAIVAAMVLHDRTGGLTCIEELENCLHPSAQAKLLRFLRDSADQWQLIVTTHSPYLVNGVQPDDVLVAVVGKDGLTKFAKPQKRKEIDELLKRGYMSFGDLMVTNFRDAIRVPE